MKEKCSMKYGYKNSKVKERIKQWKKHRKKRNVSNEVEVKLKIKINERNRESKGNIRHWEKIRKKKIKTERQKKGGIKTKVW